MTLKYSIPQLLNLRNNSSPIYISSTKQLKLQSRPRYIHRSCRRKFVFSQSGDSIPSLWSTERTVARHLRHQNDSPLGTNRPVTMERNIKRGVDFSLLRSLQYTTPSNINIVLFNTQSLSNKSCLIHSHILDRNIDIMCLTETWHQPEGYFTLNEACPPGYQYLEKARHSGRGGGLAVLHRSDLKLTPLSLPTLSTFECLAFRCKPPFTMTILIIYRPPKQNPAFISEINEFLTSFCTTSANIVILGDFNIHVDTPSCHPAVDFLQLLDNLNLKQHVDVPTHNRGHTLDLVITDSVPIENLLVYDLGVSDHKVISLEVNFSHFIKPKRQIHFRNIRNINTDTMALDLLQIPSANFTTVNESVDFYNNILSSILDFHAPVKTRTVTFSRTSPWFTPELRKMKTAGRVLERRVSKTGLTVHKIAYQEHQKAYGHSSTQTSLVKIRETPSSSSLP